MSKKNQEQIRNSIADENKQSGTGSGADFDFITETIKRKPVNKKRIFNKIILTVFLAVVFGIVASITLVFVYPIIEKRIMETELYNRVADVTGAEEMMTLSEEPVPEDTSEQEPEEEVDVELKEEPVVEEVVIAPVNATDEQAKEAVTQVIQKIEKNLELSDYKNLYKEMSSLAYETRKSLVTVTGVYSEVDWFLNTYEQNKTTSGLLIAENGKELLLLAQTKAIENADAIRVTFCNGATADAVIKKADANTDLSILAVDLKDIDEETMERIKMASLGSSRQASIVGSPVIALGNPLGIPDSMVVGQITSNSLVKSMADTGVTFLTTDISGGDTASGVLIDTEGYVLGIICADNTVKETKNVVKAYGISDLRGKIEKLSNGQDLAYLGIYGTDVTEEAAEELGIPYGAYVKEVVIDSPAMEAGIQNGDVIVKLGTTDITSFNDYKDAMLKCQPGDLCMVTLKRFSANKYVEESYEVTLGTLK